MPDPGVSATQRTDTADASRVAPLAGPLHAILLAFPVALFPAALISDITFMRTAVIQWTNFSQWLIAGALLSTGLVLALALISFFFGRAKQARGRGGLYLGVVALTFVLGLINSFQHAKDGWASVGPTGVLLSALCTVLALMAAFLVHSKADFREVRT